MTVHEVYTFRAIWPIVDEGKSYADLCREAAADLPLLVAQARAKLAAPGRFSVAPSDRVPGSGRVAESVLVFEAPATRDNRARPWLARSA